MIKINDNNFNFTNWIKFWGIYFVNNLIWNEQLKHITNK